MDKPLDYSFNEIEIGLEHHFEICINEKLEEDFSKISGDFNPLHMNEEYAKETKFKKRVCHGMLLGSFFSKLIGTIEFSGLTTTKTSGFFSIQPLLFFILLVYFSLNQNFSVFILIIPLIFFIFGNLNFFNFLYQKNRIDNLIKYIFIHFFFCFFVSLGALAGLFKYSFYRIFN